MVAKFGPIRSVSLHEFFSEMRVRQLYTADRAGISMGWQLPGSDTRGQRGVAVALDPNFPLHNEVRDVLLALAENFPFIASREIREEEEAIPNIKREYDIDMMMESPNQLRLLGALELLGGECNTGLLEYAVPGFRRAVGVAAITFLVKKGILEKVGPRVRFMDAAWARPFRRLLRAYLKLRPKLQAEIEERVKQKRDLLETRNTNTLFGRFVTEQCLIELATNGPITTGELEAALTLPDSPNGLRALIKAGVVARKRVERSGKLKNDYHVLGLNKAHPIYNELRDVLCSYGGVTASAKEPLHEERAVFTINGLFTSANYQNILMALATAVHGEIEPASIHRLYPRHDVAGLQIILLRWVEDGLLERRNYKGPALYRLSPEYKHNTYLSALLRKIADTFSAFRQRADLETELYPHERERPVQLGRARAVPPLKQ
jgi:hypothetical protein